MGETGQGGIRYQRHNALELELRKEQAKALGMAGRKLSDAIDAYQTCLLAGASEQERAKHLHAVKDNLHSLVLQREFLGFIHGNLDWVLRHYSIPQEAVDLLGSI